MTDSNGGTDLPPPSAPGADGKKPIWKRWWAIALGVLVVLVVIGGIAGGGSDGDGETSTAVPAETEAPGDTEAPAETEAPGDTEAPTTEQPATTSTTTTTVPPSTTTTVPGRDGSRSSPFNLRADADGGPNLLSTPMFSFIFLFEPADVDFTLIEEANQFNDPPPDGMKYVDTLVALTADEGVDGQLSGSDAARFCNLVGSKNKVYERALLSDVPGVLNLVDDQPDVIGGGVLGGSVIYLVDIDDSDWMLLCGGESFVIPAERG